MSDPSFPATPSWFAASIPGILHGRLGEYEQLLNLLSQRTGFTVVATDPMSGTSAIVAEAAAQTPDCIVVDGRTCGTELDLAMAITDATVAHYHPEAYPWWASGQPGLGGAGAGALKVARDLTEFEGSDIDVGLLRDGHGTRSGSGQEPLDGALRILCDRTRGPVTLIIDHFGLLARSLPPIRARELLGTVRSVMQEAGNLSVVLTEFPGGIAAAALADTGHPLYQGGSVLQFRRPLPNQIVESLAITGPQTDVSLPLLGAAAELANGVPALTWRIVALAEGSRDPQTAAFTGWQRLRHYSQPQTALQWDLLRAVHVSAPWVTAAIALGRRPHQIDANPKSVQDALKRMRDLGLVWQPESRRWALADPLLSAWARDHAPVWARRLTGRPASQP